MTTATLGRFTVRSLNPWEGPALFAITGDPVVTKYMGFRTHKTVDEATALIATYANSVSKNVAICVDGEVLGVVGCEVLRHQATMSIMLRSDKKARGIGREFGSLFVQWVFMHPQIWRLWSYVHVDNIAGQRVTERTGAVREGLMRRFEYFPNVSDEPQDCWIYSIVRS